MNTMLFGDGWGTLQSVVGFLHGHLSQQALRSGGCWISSWTASQQTCSAFVVVGFLHGHLSQQALRSGGCWLSSWTTSLLDLFMDLRGECIDWRSIEKEL